MTGLEDSSPFLTMVSLAGLPNPGKPATPWAARHVFTTRTSMTEVLHEPDKVVAVVKIKKFVVTQPPLQTFNV